MVKFDRADVRVVLMTDQPATVLRRLLDQFRSTAGDSEHARWTLLAVLALQRAAGQAMSIPDSSAEDVTEAVREDRIVIAQRAGRLVSSIAASGIAHPSTRIVDRLRTTGVAAEAARFPRLGRLLSGIAKDAQQQIDRDVGADPARMMQRMITAGALADAGSRPQNAGNPDLFGRSRSAYHPAGDLQLCGLGAWGWRTASGFEGLTAMFWEQGRQRLLTVSSTRGEGQDRTFSIAAAYQSGVGWSGGKSVEALCRTQFTLKDARLNADGRLSVSESCRVEPDQPTDPQQIDFGDIMVRKWADLTPVLRKSQPIGLRLPDPRSACVVVQPKHWGKRWFDELHQAFVWQLHDESGAALDIRVPWTDVDESSVAFLESLKEARDCPVAVLGRLQVDGQELSVYPYSVFSSGTARGHTILCPQFDQDLIRSRNESLLRRLRKKFKREPIVETRIGDAENDELPMSIGNDVARLPPHLQSVVVDIDRVVQSALEAGSVKLQPAARQTLSDSHDRLVSLGVTPLADCLADLLQSGSPGHLLRTAYRLQLFRDSLALSCFG